MPYELSSLILGPVVDTFIDKIRGIENVPATGSYVIAANHASYLDHAILLRTWVKHFNREIIFLAKKEHFNTPLQKIWHLHFKAIPTDRENGAKDALEKAIKLLQEGKIIGIYPEGTRTLTGNMQRGKTGAVRIALEGKTPIIPVAIKGTFEILPKGKYVPKLKKAAITIGKPIFLEKYYAKQNDYKTLRKITDNLMKSIANLLKHE